MKGLDFEEEVADFKEGQEDFVIVQITRENSNQR